MFGADTRSSWQLSDWFGHPLYVHPAFLVLIGLFAFLGVSARAGGAFQIVANLLIWAPTLFFGIYLHELGHATALKRFGYGKSDIVLHGFGGVTINRKRTNAPPGRSIIISLAGPFASFALAVLAFGLHFLIFGSFGTQLEQGALAMNLLSRFLWVMGMINTVWAVFNLMPVNPLDGGHVVLHALRGKYNNQRKAMKMTAKISLVALGFVVVGGLLIGLAPFFLLILGGIFGYQNWQILQASNQRRPPGGRYGA